MINLCRNFSTKSHTSSGMTSAMDKFAVKAEKARA